MKISIAMTTYNGEKFISEQLNSIIKQSYQDFELIICDDCSKDLTVNIIMEYIHIDTRIKFYQNDINLGYVKNFEKAASLCSCDLIAFSDQDDIWSEDHLQILLDNIIDADCVCANATLFKSKENKTFTKKKLLMSDTLCCDYIPVKRNEVFFFLLFNNFAQGATMLFHKRLLDYALPFPISGFFHDHWIALLAATQKGIRFIDYSVLLYRQHAGQITTNSSNKWLNLLKKATVSHSVLYRRYDCLVQIKKSIPNDLYGVYNKAMLFYKRSKSLTGRLCNIIFYLKNYKKMYCKNNNTFLVSRIVKSLLNN